MSEKLKRKRNQNPPTLNFITALTPQECVERLKDAAVNPANTRFSIRANEQEFTVEMPGFEYRALEKPAVVQFRGQFAPQTTGTRVWGQAVYDNWDFSATGGMLIGGVIFAIFIINLMVGMMDIPSSVSLSMLPVGIGIFILGLIVWVQMNKQRKQAQCALIEWVHQLLYELPSDLDIHP